VAQEQLPGLDACPISYTGRQVQRHPGALIRDVSCKGPHMPTSDPVSLPTELAVVGEHKEDSDQLLLRDEDGRYYAYSMSADTASPIEPDGEWAVEPIPDEELFA
jgi:hypothetical protein